MKKLVLSIASFCVFILAATPGWAHHSFAMFDQSRKVTVTGTITEVQWTNPHVWIHFDVVNDAGETEKWGVELTSKVHLVRRGFPLEDINVGDTATFSLSPYASGEPGGRFYTIQVKDGITYCDPGARRAVPFCQQ